MDVVAEAVWELEVSLVAKASLAGVCRGVWPISACSFPGVVWCSGKY